MSSARKFVQRRDEARAPTSERELHLMDQRHGAPDRGHRPRIGYQYQDGEPDYGADSGARGDGRAFTLEVAAQVQLIDRAARHRGINA